MGLLVLFLLPIEFLWLRVKGLAFGGSGFRVLGLELRSPVEKIPVGSIMVPTCHWSAIAITAFASGFALYSLGPAPTQ